MSRLLVPGLLSACCILAASPSLAQTPDACAALKALELPDLDLDIERAEHVDAQAAGGRATGGDRGALPAHCRIDGAFEHRVGVDGRDYAIGFALALPDEWNGRFLFQGGGGLNGTVRPPVGAQAAGDTPALARGFAVVSTDSGHRGAVFDSSFFADQQAMLNFLYSAVGKVTDVARQIVDAYYGRAAAHSYFVGCSTGGREAMIVSQRYPSEFDGVVAGSPAMRTGNSNIGMRSVSVALSRAADKDEDGRPIPGTALSDGDKQLVVDSLLAVCDADDGITDGMIFDPLGCGFDPAELTCAGPKTRQCLSGAQVRAIETAMAGPRDSAGRPVYTGYLYDTGLAASGPGTIPGLLNGAPSPVDPPVPPSTQDIDAEAAEAARAPSSLGDTAAWTNLSTFSQRGGKLLFYHGVSDPWFSALDTVRYYEALAADNGGAERVRDFSRLYLVPGMGHCSGGEATLDRFDMLSAVVGWVEDGQPPDSVVATGAAFPGRSRPLCAYPEHAQYTGTGDPRDAANFECR
jgi:hypothetical protein